MLVPEAVPLIMVTYHRAPLLERCLRSLFLHTPAPFTLDIIDNSAGAIDATLDKITDPRVTVHRSGQNLGKGRAFMSKYAQIAKDSDYFVSLDPDLLFQNEWTTDLMRLMDANPKVAVLAPVLVSSGADNFDGQLARGKLFMHRKGQESRFLGPGLYQNRHVAGPLLMVRRSFFESAGGFAQDQLYGNDDGELCKSAWREGHITAIATGVRACHLEDDERGYKEWKKRNVRGGQEKGFWDGATHVQQ